jgi:hypothetical protein
VALRHLQAVSPQAKGEAMTLDEWVERNAPILRDCIRCHLDVWEIEDAEQLLRLIMISVRDWDMDR